MGANTYVNVLTYKLITKVITPNSSKTPSDLVNGEIGLNVSKTNSFVTKVQTFVKDKSIGFGTINFVKSEQLLDGLTKKTYYNIFVSTGDNFYIDTDGMKQLIEKLV